jgi:hypothetical protein
MPTFINKINLRALLRLKESFEASSVRPAPRHVYRNRRKARVARAAAGGRGHPGDDLDADDENYGQPGPGREAEKAAAGGGAAAAADWAAATAAANADGALGVRLEPAWLASTASGACPLISCPLSCPLPLAVPGGEGGFVPCAVLWPAIAADSAPPPAAGLVPLRPPPPSPDAPALSRAISDAASRAGAAAAPPSPPLAPAAAPHERHQPAGFGPFDDDDEADGCDSHCPAASGAARLPCGMEVEWFGCSDNADEPQHFAGLEPNLGLMDRHQRQLLCEGDEDDGAAHLIDVGRLDPQITDCAGAARFEAVRFRAACLDDDGCDDDGCLTTAAGGWPAAAAAAAGWGCGGELGATALPPAASRMNSFDSDATAVAPRGAAGRPGTPTEFEAWRLGGVVAEEEGDEAAGQSAAATSRRRVRCRPLAPLA